MPSPEIENTASHNGSIGPAEPSRLPADLGASMNGAPGTIPEDLIPEVAAVEPSSTGASAELVFPGPGGVVVCPKYVGDYEILRPLGVGGMGMVFVAKNLFFGREEALKMIHERMDARSARDGFIREMHTQAGLDHSNIAKVLYAGSIKTRGKYYGRLYFVMSLEKGDFGAVIQRDGPMAPIEAANVVRRLAKAIVHAHSRGVIHCDLKPKNVLVGADGLPKVTDFGLVRLLSTNGDDSSGRPFGTPAYMPPEQARGEADERSDIYGLGAILYELLTGQPPYQGKDKLEILVRVLDPNVHPQPIRELAPRVPARLAAICMRCLRKLPAQRYRNAAALEEDLRAFLRPPLWKQRWREGAILGLCVGLGATLYSQMPPGPRTRAEKAEQAARSLESTPDKAIPEYEAAIAEYRTLLNSDLVLNRARINGKIQELETRVDEIGQAARKQQFEAQFERAQQLIREGDAQSARQAKIEKYRSALRELESLERDAARPNDWAIPLAIAEVVTRIAEQQVNDREWGAVNETLAANAKRLSLLPDNREVNLAKAENHHTRGRFYNQQLLPRKAEEEFEDGLRIRQKLRDSSTGLDVRLEADLARSFGYLGDAQLTLGKSADAEKSYRKAEEIRQRLALSTGELAHKCLHARDAGNMAGLYAWRSVRPDGTLDPQMIEKRIERLAERKKYYEENLAQQAVLPSNYLTERVTAAVEYVAARLDSPTDGEPTTEQYRECRQLLDRAFDECKLVRQELDRHGKGESVSLQSTLASVWLARGCLEARVGNRAAAREALATANSLYEALDNRPLDHSRTASANDYIGWATLLALRAELTDDALGKLRDQLAALDRLDQADRMGMAGVHHLLLPLPLRRLKAAHASRFVEIEARFRDRTPAVSNPATTAGK